MRAKPWFGFWRGLLFALLPGLRFAHPVEQPAWSLAARRRRRLLLLSVAGLAAVSIWLAAPDAHPATLTLQTLLFAWVGAGCITAIAGVWVMQRGDPHALRLAQPQRPIAADARTAIVMTICNEDIATVFAGLRATCESLAATGALKLFDVYILSDSSDPALRAAELQAWAQLRAVLGDASDTGDGSPGGRVFYRWRRVRRQRKAGNVADFCRRWGRNYRYMVVFDADSTMHGQTLLSLVRLMEDNPRAGIVQTLPQAVGHDTLHARMQQFATRVTGRLFALGMAWWQMGESHYWGHNAILRVQPFMQHCALARLPGRGGLAGDILSHDFVEAALMRRAGYEVWLAPDLGGSWEQHPPNLLDELQRDRRWCQGNLQNARLVAEPGWRPAHRVMLAMGALSYGVAPLWLLFLVAGGVAGGVSGTPALWGLTLTLLLLPRVLGVVSLQLAGRQREFGGSAPLVAGALLEALLSALVAPIRMLAHSAYVAGALTGLKLDWKSPPRDAHAVRWRDAWARVGLLALPALALAALLPATQGLAWHHVPLLLPLLLAVPFTVYGGSERVGLALRRHGWLAIAEERQLPRTLARAGERRDFRHLGGPAAWPVLARDRMAAATAAAGEPSTARRAPVRAATAAARRPTALGFGMAALLAVALVPQEGMTPELPSSWHVQRDLLALMRPSQSGPVEKPRAAIKPVALRAARARLPAASIDDDVRRRAAAFVARALAESDA